MVRLEIKGGRIPPYPDGWWLCACLWGEKEEGVEIFLVLLFRLFFFNFFFKLDATDFNIERDKREVAS